MEIEGKSSKTKLKLSHSYDINENIFIFVHTINQLGWVIHVTRFGPFKRFTQICSRTSSNIYICRYGGGGGREYILVSIKVNLDKHAISFFSCD